jgi:hypothetical protein
MALGDYTKTPYVDGNAPAISAANLNNNENKLKEIDTWFATSLPVNQGLVGAWGANVPEIPNDPAGTTYVQDAWASDDGWSGTRGTLSRASGVLIFTATDATSAISRSIITIPTGSTIRMRMRSANGSALNLSILNTTLATTVVSGIGPVSTEYSVYNFTTINPVTAQSIGIYTGNTATSGVVLEVDWIYIGTGAYLANSLLDNSGNGNHGTIYGATPVDGISWKALIGDGVNDYVSISNESAFDFVSDFSVSLWIKTSFTYSSVIASIFGKIAAGFTSGFDLILSTTSKLRFAIRGSSSIDTTTASTTVVNDNIWHHVVCIGTATSAKMFIDGVQSCSVSGTWTPTTNNSDVLFFRRYLSESSFFPGTIDEPRIYDRALTADEVRELYQGPGKYAIHDAAVSHAPDPNTIAVRDSNGNLGVNGIVFPAIKVPSTNANTLDDYEEGTWTPAIIGTTVSGTGTYSLRRGTYTKIGDSVHARCWVAMTTHSGGSGNLRLIGLPFTVGATAGEHSAASIYAGNITLASGYYMMGYVEPNTTRITLEQVPGGGGAPIAIPLDTAFTLAASVEYRI